MDAHKNLNNHNARPTFWWAKSCQEVKVWRSKQRSASDSIEPRQTHGSLHGEKGSNAICVVVWCFWSIEETRRVSRGSEMAQLGLTGLNKVRRVRLRSDHVNCFNIFWVQGGSKSSTCCKFTFLSTNDNRKTRTLTLNSIVGWVFELQVSQTVICSPVCDFCQLWSFHFIGVLDSMAFSTFEAVEFGCCSELSLVAVLFFFPARMTTKQSCFLNSCCRLLICCDCDWLLWLTQLKCNFIGVGDEWNVCCHLDCLGLLSLEGELACAQWAQNQQWRLLHVL